MRDEPLDIDYSAKFSSDTWRRFFKLAAPHKALFVRLLFVMAWVAVVDNIAPMMTRFAIDYFIANDTRQGLIIYSIAFLIVIILQGIGTRFFLTVAGDIEIALSRSIRSQGFNKLQELSFSYYDRTAVGWIIARLISDTSRLAEVIAWSMVDVFWGGASIIAITVMLFSMDSMLALLSLAVIPFFLSSH